MSEQTISGVSNSAAAMAPKAAPLNDPRRKVLFLSLHRDDWLDEVYSQLYRALARNAYLSEVCDPVDAAAALASASLPNVVVVSDAAFADKDHSAILEKLPVQGLQMLTMP